MVGIVLPLIPTTIPLLVAAALFAKGSPRFHRWLTNHRILGPYITNYREHRGMTLRHKRFTLASLWIGMGVSGFVLRHSLVGLIILAVVLIGVTVHILTIQTVQPRSDAEPT